MSQKYSKSVRVESSGSDNKGMHVYVQRNLEF